MYTKKNLTYTQQNVGTHSIYFMRNMTNEQAIAYKKAKQTRAEQ